MNLRQRIGTAPADRPFVVTSERAWTLPQIVDQPICLTESVTGKRIAVRTNDPARLIQALLNLDGVAEAIVLIPWDTPATIVESFLRQGRCDALLSSRAGVSVDDGVFSLEELHDSGVGVASSAQQRLDGTRWILSTSGTTGVPRLVAHSLVSLAKSARVRTGGASETWGLLYDPARFAGLQVVLQSLLSGATLLAPSSGLALDGKIAMLVEGGCTHLSATPTMWRKIAMSDSGRRLSLKQITLGGEIADARILSMLSDLFPDARISHIYASTEAGVGFSVTDRKPGFPGSWLRSAPSGVELAIRDGRLFIRNGEVLPDYVGTDLPIASDDGWIDTGDAVEISDGRVRFLGRANGVINVGGDKVHPEEVESVMTSHPDVLSAQALARPNPFTGSLVVVEVVLRAAVPDEDKIRRDLLELARTALDRHKVPAAILFVPESRLNSSGKMVRQ